MNFNIDSKIDEIVSSNDSDKALNLLEELLNKEKDSYNQIKIMHKIIEIYGSSALFNKILPVAKRMLDTAMKEDNTSYTIESFLILAEAYDRLHNSELASQNVELAEMFLNYLDEDSDERKEKLAMIKERKGGIFFRQKHFKEALGYYRESLDLYKGLQNKSKEADLLSRLGLIYHSTFRFKKAITRYEEVISLYKSLGNHSKLAIVYNNIGEIYRLQGKYSEAEKYYKMSLELGKKFNNIYYLNYSYHNLGVIYENRGEFDKAIEMLKKSLSIAYEQDNNYEIMNSLLYLSYLYIITRSPEETNKLFMEAKEIAKKTSSKDISYQLAIIEAFKLIATQKRLDRVEAVHIFNTLLKEPIEDRTIKTFVYLNILRFFVEELIFVNSVNVIEEMEPIFEELIEISNKLYLLPFALQVKVLRGIIYFLTEEVDKASALFEEVIKTASEKQIYSVQGHATMIYNNGLIVVKSEKWKNEYIRFADKLEMLKIREVTSKLIDLFLD